jgi:hypothetical protein
MTKVAYFTQKVSAYRKACHETNRSLDITVLERIVDDVFTIEEQRELGSSARIVTDALNQTRDGA